MALGSWRQNIIWKLLRNDSGVILEILEIDSGSFFIAKVCVLNRFPYLKLIFSKLENSEVISQYLLVNIDLGPTLKCAPGHDSIEDSIVIKSD